tara:strand:+ start:1100 stop:2353 length:1254 start_codon:yes stop_codon:yes gene_type:complete
MKKNKTIIFIHQNFPAQYKHLAPLLAKNENYDVHSISLADFTCEGVKHHKYILEKGNTKGIHPLAQEFEAKIIRANSLNNVAIKMKKDGIIADLIIAHPGWGETLFVKNVWPEAKVISYLEFFYYSNNADVDFDPEFEFDNEFLANKLSARNAPIVLDLYQSDHVVTPTEFQASLAPEIFSDKLEIIHEGIDTELLKRNDDIKIDVNGNVLTNDNKIVLYIARNLEPYRGYHSFIRSIPDVLKEHPDAYILIVGGHDVSYGHKPPEGEKFSDIFFNETKDTLNKDQKDIFEKQVLFLGWLDYEKLIRLMQICTTHVYLSYPFVLSWSLLESMSCESVIIGSNTKPVKEVIEHNKTGLLVDFFDYKEISNAISSVLSDPNGFEKIRESARKLIIDKFDLNKVSIPKYLDLIERVLYGE